MVLCSSHFHEQSIIQYPILFILYFFVILLESGRIPIDLIESESELISGYNIEFSGFLYALFASSEYSTIFFHIVLLSIIFSNYLIIWFQLFVLLRSTLPRIRYTHLMNIIYSAFLPITLVFYVIFHFNFFLLLLLLLFYLK